MQSRDERDLPSWIYAESHVSCTNQTCVVEETGEHVVILSIESPLDHEFVVDSVCLNGGVSYRDADGAPAKQWTTETIRVRGDKDFRRVSERRSRPVFADRSARDEAIEVTVTYNCLDADAVGETPALRLEVDTVQP